MNFQIRRVLQQSNTSTREGRPFWSGAGKFAVLLLGVLLLLLYPASHARAEQQVITIYFGGTGLVEKGYMDGNFTRWSTPSLLSTLHHNHVDTDDDNQYKIYVAGVGAAEESSGVPEDHCEGNPPALGNASFTQQKESHNLICRNWQFTVFEAILAYANTLHSIENLESHTVTLNLVGHSRGAIAAIWFLREMLKNPFYSGDWLTTINLITLDPVPGMGMLKDLPPYRHHYDDVESIGWDAFRLDARLTKFVAIYASDERSNRFSAIIPYLNPVTDAIQLQVKGSHQTMAGNTRKSGHWPMYYIPGVGSESDTKLKVVHDVVATAVVELLSSEEWGSVPFKQVSDGDDPAGYEVLMKDLFPNGFDDQSRKTKFLEYVTGMHHSDLSAYYSIMRGSSFFPLIPFPPPPLIGLLYLPLEQWRNDNCRRVWLLVGNDTYKRCVERVTETSHTRASIDFILPGENESFIKQLGNDLSGEEAWRQISVLAHGDSDGDGHSDNLDNCPEIENPGQEDGDTDGIGDVCDNCPDIANTDQGDRDSDTVGDLCDNCPDSFNTIQTNSDDDTLGDACDNCPEITNETQDDVDLDRVGDVCDNCIDKRNTDQADYDANDIGDACQDPHHYTCYKAETAKGTTFNTVPILGLTDQFGGHGYDAVKVERLCAPTRKTPVMVTPELLVDLNGNHLEGYKIEESGLSCGPCEGGVRHLVIQYNGSETIQFNVEGKVTQPGPWTVPDPHGDPVVLQGKDKDGKMGSSIRFIDTTSGEEIASFHTSCSRPIGIGTKSDNGLFEVIGGFSVHGGELGSCKKQDQWVVNPPWDTCAECEGGVSHATFRYYGTAGEVKIVGDKDQVLYHNLTQASDSLVQIKPLPGEDKLPKTISLTGVGGTVDVHMSCSKPFGPGLVLGDFTVQDASSKKGGKDMCPVVRIDNQFGTEFLTIKKAQRLLVPTVKDLSGKVDPTERILRGVDHYKCYDVTSAGLLEGLVINLEDQFDQREFEIDKTELLCNPVEKAHELVTPIINDDGHLTCYKIKPLDEGYCALVDPNDQASYPLLGAACKKDKECGKGLFCKKDVEAQAYLFNQFGDEIVDVKKAYELCVPSVKTVALP